jgi:peptide/nickel transport system ATP-binding protein
MALLDVRDLTVTYETLDQQVKKSLDGIDLSLYGGETLGIVGESGSGKSVLLRSILGLLTPKERIESGDVTFRDVLLPLSDDDAMRKYRGDRISLIQSGQRTRLDPVRRIGDQLVDIMGAHDHVAKDLYRTRADELLRSVGISDADQRLRAYPHELSGGMCQRVVIALALANSPDVLLADDPTAGLDVTIQIQILDLFRTLVRENNAASILTTRDLGQVAHYCDRIIVLSDGKIVEQAPVRQFFVNPSTEHGRYLVRAAMTARGEESMDGGTVGSSTAPQESPVAVTVRPSHAPSEAQIVLEVRDLVKNYKIPRHIVHAVNGVSFSIARGKTLALVGESGSGKTTVGHCVAGLVTPTSGEIRLLGREIEGISTRKRSRETGLETQVVFQEPWDSLNPRWTLAMSIDEPLRHQHKLDTRERAARVLELLDLVAVPRSLAHSRPSQTTAGVQQRIAIARALAVNPQLIVLDEPTSVLDLSVKAQIIELLIKLQKELDLTYLFISHDMTAVRMIAHDIAIMYLGRILEYGSAADVFESQTNPYGRALLSSVLYPDPNRAPERFRLEGEIPSAIELPPGCPLYSRCPLAQPHCNEVVPVLQETGHDGRLSACLRTGEIIAAGGVDELLVRDKSV